MPFREKRDGFKEWVSSLFPNRHPRRRDGLVPDPRHRDGFITDVLITDLRGFSVHNSIMTSVPGTQTTLVQGDHSIVAQIMSLLSQHTIPGAAHDSSARDPPPRCHPDTRVKPIARIIAWFMGEAQQELILWITGPAGAGKSALLQTIAEYLSREHLLGASVFISRSNGRNNSNAIFITIAYQLAIRVEAYRSFITERLSLDPGLLNGNLRTQFKAFIVEPFVGRKIGVGNRRLGVLLDGLDELRGTEDQCEIIHLISTFARENPDVPLAWMIASRPEPHIYDTFEEDGVSQSCWSEHIPIDSVEACQDVERFLRSSFEVIQKKFRRSLPGDWPSMNDFLMLTAAASGFFPFAQVVMQYIRDLEYADPASRLEVLLSCLDLPSAITAGENPLIHLDALYHEILVSIPSAHWDTVKRLTRFMIHPEIATIAVPHNFRTLRGMSILFGIAPHVIHVSTIKCHSVVKIPAWKVAHMECPVFFHASFTHYLKDPHRSGEFYVGSDKDADGDVVASLLSVWDKCSGADIGKVETAWQQYCSQWDGNQQSSAVEEFHAKLFHDAIDCLVVVVCRTLGEPAESSMHAQLINIHMIKLCYYFDEMNVKRFVQDLMTIDINHGQLLRRVRLKDLKFEHLDWEEMSPARTDYARRFKLTKEQWILHRPSTSAELQKFISELETLQQGSPELDVIIVGGVPEGRVAAFKSPLKDEPGSDRDFVYYIIPYSE